MNGIAGLVLAAGCLLAVAGVVIAVLAIRQSRRQAAPAAQAKSTDPFNTADEDSIRGNPRILAPGDIVEVRGRSLAVRGSLQLSEGGWGWSEHLLDDAEGGKVWLSVEEDPDLEVVLWTEVPSATVQPGPPTLDFDGRRYTSDESGRASFTATGTTGLNPTGTVAYHDYAAPDGALLSFEAYGEGGKWEVGRGEKLHRAEYRIYPQAR